MTVSPEFLFLIDWGFLGVYVHTIVKISLRKSSLCSGIKQWTNLEDLRKNLKCGALDLGGFRSVLSWARPASSFLSKGAKLSDLLYSQTRTSLGPVQDVLFSCSSQPISCSTLSAAVFQGAKTATLLQGNLSVWNWERNLAFPLPFIPIWITGLLRRIDIVSTS